MQPDDTYYLKALDNYPYDLDETVEALQYGLAINPEHPGLLTLQGKVFANELRSVEMAMQSFQAAIAYEPDYKQAYYELGMLLLRNGKMNRAVRIIQLAFKQFGNDQHEFLYLQAHHAEIEKRYDDAIELLETAKLNCYDTEGYDNYCDEIKRIKQKCVKPLTVSGYKVYYQLK